MEVKPGSEHRQVHPRDGLTKCLTAFPETSMRVGGANPRFYYRPEPPFSRFCGNPGRSYLHYGPPFGGNREHRVPHPILQAALRDPSGILWTVHPSYHLVQFTEMSNYELKTCLETCILGAGAIARWVRCLPCMHAANPGSIPVVPQAPSGVME